MTKDKKTLIKTLTGTDFWECGERGVTVSRNLILNMDTETVRDQAIVYGKGALHLIKWSFD